ncbi:T9SS type A sorting domain-containing protein [Chryseobacterium sp.]|uniref:T9SS type A sorting domain-containing protein n=1 Tax=Chryseobacterium sp. TaxID=1871047 RepID=UPI0025BA2BDB|nr:T9SS type A sorting domain-containing protein [Chryseobacterium sp.]MBV8324756.1 T9SS type A sorting domain-containing protein [Chryseobacterium sp.]
MKINVSTNPNGLKTIILTLLVFVMNSLSHAQIIKTYASSQTNQTYGICIGCGVIDPENAVGSNEDDYSTLIVPLGLLARTEQTLIFPTSITNANKLVIGIGTGQAALTAQLIGGVSVETFNGQVSNNDYKNINNEILKLGGTDPSKGEVEFITSKPYDRVKINLNAGLLNLNGGLRIYYSYQYKDPYINLMAHTENGQVTFDKKIPAEGSEITLTNTDGKEVFRSKLTSHTFNPQQPLGMYIMTVKTKEGKTYTQKIMIK